MAVRIAHASHDENGRYSGGKAGDQTGNECYIRSWYNRPWNCVIRFKDATMAAKVAQVMVAAANNNKIGYDQGQRNTVLTQARKFGYDMGKITEACEGDCSSVVSVACMYAGMKESALYNGNCCTTSTLRNALVKNADVWVFTESRYTASSDYLLKGDILLYEGHHVAVAIDDGAKVKAPAPSPVVGTCTVTLKYVSIGDKGAHVKACQSLLKGLGIKGKNGAVLDLDGDAGSNTDYAIRQFQTKKGLSVDGVCGKDTWAALLGA